MLTLAQLTLPHNEMLQSRTNNYIRACIQKISFDPENTKNVCYYRCKWLKELLSDVIVSVHATILNWDFHLRMFVLLFTLVRDASFFISVQPRHVHIQLSLRLLWWVKNAEKYFWYYLEKSRIMLFSNKSCIHDRSSWTPAWICSYTVMNMFLYVQF